jgi:hypothetical protein
MGNNILLKKSSVTGKVPLTTDLQYGEVAINYADGKLYYKTNSATVDVLNPTESNNFQTIAVSGQSSIVAGSATATVNFSPSVGLDITTNAGTNTVTFAHSDTSSVGNINSDNGAGTVIQDVALTFDTFGHVTAASVGTVNLDSRYLQAEVDTLNTVTTRGATTTNAITVGGITVNGDASVTGSLTTIDAVNFHTTASVADASARLFWDATFGLLRVGTGSANVSFDLGMTTVVYATNDDSVNITKGQVVYLSGAQGNRPTVRLALNTSDTTSSRTLGFAAENINTNQAGYIITGGVIEGLSLGAYTPGDVLWLGSSAGTFTTTKPVAPYHGVFLGVVQRANNGNGQIYVKVQNGYELDEIHDVQIISKADKDSLFYDSTAGVWKNYTPANARTNLGLGTIATQNASSVTITGGTINSTSVGATTPSTGAFTTLSTTGNATIGGNLIVQGTTTTVSATNLSISDNLIYLNNGATNTNPDIGFAANYNDGTYHHTGFFRDATDGYWKVFQNYSPEPDASLYIDTSDASFQLADIQAANFRGALVGNASTATTLQTARTINGVSFNGSANITITSNTTNALTLGDGLSGTSFNGSAAVTAAVDSTIARRADVHYIGTTSVALNRTSAALALTGISSVTAPTDLTLNTAVTVTSGGNVGINTSSPSYKLHITHGGSSYGVGVTDGTTASGIYNGIPLAGITGAYFGTINGNDCVFGASGGGAYLIVKSSGNVGIGTSSPSYKLQVNGTFNSNALWTDGSAIAYWGNGSTSAPSGILTWDTPYATVAAASGKKLYLSANGAGNQNITIDTSGNVGINNTAPAYRLDVGTADNDAIRIRNSSGTQSNGIALGVGQNSPFLDLVNGVEFRIKGNTYANLGTWNSGNNTKFIIDASGNVGIGTASPNLKLDVQGGGARLLQNGGVALNFSNNSTRNWDIGLAASTDAFYIKDVVANSTRVTIDTGGNVGIGTTSPAAKLDVYGTVHIGATANTNGSAVNIAQGNYNQVNLTYAGYSGWGLLIGYGDGSASGSYHGLNTAAIINVNDAPLHLGTGNAPTLTLSGGYAGIGTITPSQTLHVVGNARITGALYDSSNSAGTSGQVLTSTGSGTAWSSAGASVSGSGTTNYIAKFTGSTVLGNSQIFDNGTNVGIGTNSPDAQSRLTVAGVGGITVTGDYSGVPAVAGLALDYHPANSAARISVADGSSGWTKNLLLQPYGGNLGVGTTSPGEKLEVAGNILSKFSSTDNSGFLQYSGNTHIFSITRQTNSVSLSGYDGVGLAPNATSGPSASYALYAKSNGNVGIGTTNPALKLSVNGSILIEDGYAIRSGFSIGASLIGRDAGTASKIAVGSGQSGDYLVFNSGGGEKVRIDTSGNVGIGRTDPTASLDIHRGFVASGLYEAKTLAITTDNGSSTWTLGQIVGYVAADSGNSTYGFPGGLMFKTKLPNGNAGESGVTTSMVIDANGNVGIATTAPSQKLDVQGNVAVGPDTVYSYSTITTTATTAGQVITAVSTSTYRTVKFIIQASDSTSGKYQSQEILAVHNGTTAAHTQYTAINVGGAVATFDVDISANVLRLLCTPLTTNSTVFKVQMVLIKT